MVGYAGAWLEWVWPDDDGCLRCVPGEGGVWGVWLMEGCEEEEEGGSCADGDRRTSVSRSSASGEGKSSASADNKAHCCNLLCTCTY